MRSKKPIIRHSDRCVRATQSTSERAEEVDMFSKDSLISILRR
jgi:hypothetical protein